MSIVDGFRVHEKRYRMPDLLSYEEMRMYFVSNYQVDVELKPVSEEMLESSQGVGTLPVEPIPTATDVEAHRLRRMLGIEELEKKSGIHHEPGDLVYELDSRVMSSEEFAEKYGTDKQGTKVDPPTTVVDKPDSNKDDSKQDSLDKPTTVDKPSSDPDKGKTGSSDKPSTPPKESPAEKLENLTTKSEGKSPSSGGSTKN